MLKPTLLSLSLATACLVACYVSPTGRTRFNSKDDAQMDVLGAQAFDQILASPENAANVVRSGPLYDRVTNIITRLRDVANQTHPELNFQWDWVVLDDPATVNAFCLPGGKIAVYSGIMQVATDDSMLAAVIGHEIAHATAKHGATRISQQELLGVLTVPFADQSQATQETILGLLGAVANVSDAWQRNDELEADILGLRYLIHAGYDPNAAIAFWQKMEQLGESGTPEFLSTHPSHGTRIDMLQRAVANYQTMGDDAFRWDLYR